MNHVSNIFDRDHCCITRSIHWYNSWELLMLKLKTLWQDLKSIFLFWFTLSDGGYAGVSDIKPKGLK